MRECGKSNSGNQIKQNPPKAKSCKTISLQCHRGCHLDVIYCEFKAKNVHSDLVLGGGWEWAGGGVRGEEEK